MMVMTTMMMVLMLMIMMMMLLMQSMQLDRAPEAPVRASAIQPRPILRQPGSFPSPRSPVGTCPCWVKPFSCAYYLIN